MNVRELASSHLGMLHGKGETGPENTRVNSQQEWSEL